MKESIFNIYYNTEDGVRLAFNSLSCALAVVDESYVRLINQLKMFKNDIPNDLKEVYQAAIEGSFIVEEDCDELLELELRRNIQKYYLGALAFTIAPTLACNFKCIYCYESAKPGVMDDRVQERLVDYVKERAKCLNSLQINWYGGEPLLGIDVIRNLSKRFISICSEYEIEYSAFIISNGSLLTDEIIEDLIRYKVKGIQITLDGPPDVHDRRRVSKNGVYQFANIIDNINKLLSTGEIEVVIRINVDKNNTNDVENLIAILADKLINEKIRITFGQVTAYTEACKSIENTCYNNVEFAVNLLKYYSIVSDYGFGEYNKFPYPEAKLNYCCAEVANSFVVDFEGYVYKCWNEVGNVSRAIGNLEDEKLELCNSKHARWISRSPFNEEKCVKCKLLPICMGGCPYNTCVKKQENSCDLFKYNLKDVMLKYYKLYNSSMKNEMD